MCITVFHNPDFFYNIKSETSSFIKKTTRLTLKDFKLKKAKQGIGHSQRSAHNIFLRSSKKCPSGLIALQLSDCPI